MEKTSSNFEGLGGLFFGFIVGGSLGAAAAFLFAPKSGKELRSDIRERGSRVYEDAQKILSDVEAKSRSILEDARRKAEELRKEADDRLCEAHNKACKALGCEEETRAEA